MPVCVPNFDDEELVSKVRTAWRYLVKKDKELGNIEIMIGSYAQWLRDKVVQIGLPHKCQQSKAPEPSSREPEEDEEVKQLKEKVSKVETEKEQFKRERDESIKQVEN